MPGINVRKLIALLALAVPLAPRSDAVQSAPSGPPESQSLAGKAIARTLENGWQFLLLPRQEAPSVSFETCVVTGPAHELPGESGVTALIGRLLFTGSDRVGTLDWEAEEVALEAVDAALERLRAARGGVDEQALASAEEELRRARELAASLADPEEYRRILQNAGGGTTLGTRITSEGTHFVVSLPSSRLELWCWMEAERFSRPAMRGFCAEREALLEDRSVYLEDHPTERLNEALRHGAWPDLAGPGEPTGGWAEDLALLTRESTLAFFRAGYGARFMTTAIVGDFDPETLWPMIERYFSKIPAGPRRDLPPPPEDASFEQRRIVIEAAAPAQLSIAWNVPPLAHADRPAIEIAVRLLGQARSSRLQRRLIRERSIATELSVTPAWASSRTGGLAVIRATPAEGMSTIRIEELIHEEIARLTREGPEPEELLGVKRAVRAEHLRRLRDNGAVAAGLIENQVLAGAWSRFFEGPALADAVTSMDIQRVLSTYFTTEKCLVVTQTRQEEN